jgi:hypothetical protein
MLHPGSSAPAWARRQHPKGERTGRGVSVAIPYGTTALCPISALRSSDSREMSSWNDEKRAVRDMRDISSLN